jgi:hypothetical protein
MKLEQILPNSELKKSSLELGPEFEFGKEITGSLAAAFAELVKRHVAVFRRR